MRLVRLLFCFVLLCASGALLLLVLAQNWRTTQVDFFGLQYPIHLAWVLVGAAAFGALVTLVLLLPGRFSAMVHTWSLERELRQWEQNLWQVQEQRERLLVRHEHLLEAHQHLLARHEHFMQAHERALQLHHRLVGEHSQAIAERDQARAQVAAVHASSAHQPAQQSSMPRVAAASPGASGATGAAVRVPAASKLHAHGRHGGRVSAPAPRSPRWAAPWPTAHAAEPTSRASVQVAAGDDDRVASARHDTAPSRDQPVVMQPTLVPVKVGVAGDMGVVSTRECPPASASEPLPPAAQDSALGRAVPVLPTEPAARVPMAPPAAPPQFSLRWLQRAAERASVSLSPLLAALRGWVRTDVAGMVAALTARRDILESWLAHLKQTIFSDALPLGSSRSTPHDLPSDDDQK